MANPGQRSKSRAAAPAPRKKVTIALTASQAAQLRALWQEHSAALHVMLSGWCGDVQNASDILQELFRRLAETPSLMGRMKNARAFLAVSARRLAVDFARRSTTRSAYQTAAGAEVPTAANPGPTDEDLRAAIRAALEALPADQRSVFNHKILNGRTLEEIARFEGISLNTAASRLRYALDKIRGQLRPYYDDLNRSQFKNMKNDLNQNLSANKRIITPLEPKRVPSVVPGFEGLAALSTDAGVSDAPTPELAECYALPVVEAPAPDFVEPQIHIDPLFVPPPTGGIDPIPETCWEQTAPEIVDGGNGELPELVICEMFPPDGQIPTEWLKPFELPEEFLVTIFEGEGEAEFVDGNPDSKDGAGEEAYASWTHLAPPFGLDNGFEISVLPVPEEFALDADPREYLVRYDAFLAENPDWGALDPDVMEAQVITPSGYFSELEFGTPSKAAAFDNWYATHLLGGDSSEGETQDGSAESDPSGEPHSFEPKELLPRYDTFLADNPTWVQDNQSGEIQLQVVTPSGYFPELEFGTPGEAAAFDNWYTSHYSAVGSGTLLLGGNPVDFPTEISLGDGGLPGGDEPSVIGEPVFGEGEIVFRDGSSWLNGEIRMNGEIQPNWRNGDDAPEPVPGLAANSPGLVIGGGNPVIGGQSGGTVVVSSGVLNLGEADFGRPSNQGAAGSFEILPVVGSNNATMTLSIGSAFGPEALAVTGDLPAETVVADALTTAVAGDAGDLPAEIIVPDALGTEAAMLFGNAAAGLASTPGEALIVEFGVLSPSQTVAERMQGAISLSAIADGAEALPQSSPFASIEPLAEAPAETAAWSAAAEGDSLPQSDTPTASLDAMTDASDAGHDPTTVASGAVAVGGVAHGSGAAAAAVRKPLPQI